MHRKPGEQFTPIPESLHDTQREEQHNERRRKLGKVALRSLETAFSVATLVQSGHDAIAIANELIHDHPASISVEDSAHTMADATEKARIEYVQKQMDNLAGIEADQQEHVKAQWHVDASFSEQSSLLINIPDDKL